MKIPFLFLLIISLGIIASCANHAKSLNGNWRQIFLGYEGENTVEGYITDSAIIRLNLSKNHQIEFDYQDGLDNDLADSIFFNYPELNFRKQNYNKTYNRYQMRYLQECDCFNGKFKSFNGRSVLVKWVRN